MPSDIDRSAPVLALHTRLIDARLEDLWRLHSEIDAWPSWQADIASAHLDGPFAAGSAFTWATGGLTIASEIWQVMPQERTLWGGPANGIVGIHSWRFTPVGDGAVQVHTEESWSGDPVDADVAHMQELLDVSLESWLDHLDRAARVI
ncbi:MAG TPA: SRPBCC family protein [Amnibacterium sp.]|uniref:SRPBCC family protein n=1 Tax=Amnibacterium sp. TaxID=1872496 RepID=UPI002F95A72B